MEITGVNSANTARCLGFKRNILPVDRIRTELTKLDDFEFLKDEIESLKKVLLALDRMEHVITIPEEIRVNACKALDAMLAVK